MKQGLITNDIIILTAFELSRFGKMMEGSYYLQILCFEENKFLNLENNGCGEKLKKYFISLLYKN